MSINIKDRFWDHFPKSVNLSVADYMLKRERVTQLQFGICELLLDIESYLNKGDASFYHNNYSKELYGENYDREASDKRFKDVIDSVKKNGYDMNSFVLTNKKIELGNGTHRTAMLLYLRQMEVKAKVFHHSDRNYFGYADETLKRLKAPKEYVDEIWSKFEDVQNLLLDIGASYNILVKTDIETSFLCDCDAKRMHKIKPSTFRRLLGKTVNLESGGTLYQLTLNNPDYYCHHRQIISKKMEEIERLLKVNKNYLFVSRNCTEGKELFDGLKDLFE